VFDWAERGTAAPRHLEPAFVPSAFDAQAALIGCLLF